MNNQTVNMSYEVMPLLNYSLHSMGLPVIVQMEVSNASTDPVIDAVLDITSDNNSIIPYRKVLASLQPEDTTVVDCTDVGIEANSLLAATEKMIDTLRFSLSVDDKVHVESSTSIEILPFDNWAGLNFAESIASFSTPNHPVIANIRIKASEYLKKWSGNPALDAYQSDNVNRVRQQAAALFLAIKEEGIVYSEPPANYELGQRIRLCDTVLEQHIGTCLDLSMLYLSCLESIGLHPLLILMHGHAYAGVWLEERSFPETVGVDPSALMNRIAQGVMQIAIVECTHLTNSHNSDFEMAEKQAQLNLARESDFYCVVDIYRARSAGILPLPLRVREAGVYRVEVPSVSMTAQQNAPQDQLESTAVIAGTLTETTKIDLWERNLLDLSLRNNLLNMRIASRLTPIAAPTLPELENAFSLGHKFSILPKPSEWEISGKPGFEGISLIGSHVELLKGELASHRLRTFLTEHELTKTLTNLYRVSRSSLEETGSNLLYLTLGALRWRRPADDTPHYAPLILLPVELTRKTVKSGYKLGSRDEEAQVNISLLELLRREYGIEIPELDPLPQDQHGVDVRVVFNTFRKMIMDQPGWEVLEFATLGLFSFSQFVMWNDVRNHQEELTRSPVVRSLIDGCLAWEAQSMIQPEEVDISDLLLPIQADASQAFAIKASLEGNSFVLHGPPGTGKSQTITGIIANALANDKRVLFVSEKAAALNVVDKRLDALGLGPFCLELHSNKSTKSHVLDQLQRAIDARKTHDLLKYAAAKRKASALEAGLESYAKALRKRNSAGLSLREQICEYEKVQSAKDLVTVDETFLSGNPSSEDVEGQFYYIERLIALVNTMGSPSRHPLCRIKGESLKLGAQFVAEDLLQAYIKTVESFISAGNDVAETLERKIPETASEWTAFTLLAIEVNKWKELPENWLLCKELYSLLDDIEQVAREEEQLRIYMISYGSQFKPSFFTLDYSGLEKDWTDARMQGILKRKRAKQTVMERVSQHLINPVEETQMAGVLRVLQIYTAKTTEFERHLKMIQPLIERYATLNTVNWSHVMTAVACAYSASSSLQDDSYLPIREKLAGNKAGFDKLGNFIRTSENLAEQESRLSESLGLPTCGEHESWYTVQKEFCESVSQNSQFLQEWSAWGNLAETARQMGLSSVVCALESEVNAEELLPSYKKALYKAMCVASLKSETELTNFSGSIFDEMIRQYQRADGELRECAKEELVRKLTNRIPDLTAVASKGSEAAVLKRAIRSKGRGISIRELFSQIPELLSKLSPCMLMSPLSVSQFLDFDQEPFDLLVFDEASQLQTCKAVGALARARHAVVVGDPKQMPPTMFFQGQVSDEDFESISDMESILDDCLAINLPETYLDWHYRSRHESLISFSNTHFYESKLHTFPSADDRTMRVIYRSVDGCYDGKGENRAEAEAIVSELKGRYSLQGGAASSIGIITFNVKQQTLIEDLLQKAFYADPGFEQWAMQSEEPLFIKNLENVQGDERDTIFFSVTYAPDRDGKMAMRFGPINMEGGWRRLNVAITRARKEMLVFAVLSPDRIDIGRAASPGPRTLKAFLEYAQRGKQFLTQSEISNSADGTTTDTIAEEIAGELAKHGYETRCSIGRSSFKVDVGVIDPLHKSRSYLAGILLDGDSYSKARLARDRAITQSQMLESLGWSIHRIWTLDWWANRKRVLENLLEFLEEAKKQTAEKESEVLVNQNDQASDRTDDVKSAEIQASDMQPTPIILQREYEPGPTPIIDYSCLRQEYDRAMLPLTPVSSDDYQQGHAVEIQKRFEEIITFEAPIQKQLLCNKVRESFGIGRSGRQVQNRSEQILGLIPHRETVRGEDIFIWRTSQDPEVYCLYRVGEIAGSMRSADQLPDEEIIACALDVLQETGEIPKADLIRAMAQRFGYQRVASRITQIFGEAIRKALATGKLALTDSGDITLPSFAS
ncbi:MAG: DUF4011 domain-containing protein [Coriobacteriales bacterium]|nr:DUF4011 domain-containing protein [Coriobacteriales bacterium]